MDMKIDPIALIIVFQVDLVNFKRVMYFLCFHQS